MDIRSTVAVAVVAAVAASTPAYAQSSEGVDPSSDSPSGQQYSIPVENGRADAAPKGRPGGTGTDGRSGAGAGDGSGGGGQGDSAGTPAATPPSSIKSENGFGSSSQVPGVPPAGSSSGAGSSGKRAGKGSKTGRRGTAAPTEGDREAAIRRSTIIASAPQSTGGIHAGLLLALCVVLAGGLGLVARSAARRG